MTTDPLVVTLSRVATIEDSRSAHRNQLGNQQDMAELAKQIIRQQWTNRHHPDDKMRSQAVTLIKTHVDMLRTWQDLRS